MSNLLVMVVIEPCFRPLSMSISWSMEIICNCALFIIFSLLGVRRGCLLVGSVPKLHHLLKPACQTMTLFSLLLLIINLEEMKIKHSLYTQKVPLYYTESTCVVFSSFEIHPGRKVMSCKVLQVFQTRGSRTFLLPPEENGERHRAKVTRKVVEIIDQQNGHRVENINFILDIGNGKVE